MLTRLMTVSLVVLLFPLFALGILVRRLVRGPLRPGWSWRQEAVVRYFRWLVRRVARVLHSHGDVRRMKRLLDRLPPRPGRLLRRVALTAVDAGGVSGEWIVRVTRHVEASGEEWEEDAPAAEEAPDDVEVDDEEHYDAIME